MVENFLNGVSIHDPDYYSVSLLKSADCLDYLKVRLF